MGRERETIPIPENINTIEGVMVHFSCNQKVAKASLARGYFIVDYNKRTVCPSLSEFDAEAAYRMVRFIYRRKFEDRLPWYIEAQDLIQEGFMRLLELSGHPKYQERKFMFFKAYGFMATYIQSQSRLRGFTVSHVDGEGPAMRTPGGTMPAMIGWGPWRRHEPGRATRGRNPGWPKLQSPEGEIDLVPA